MKTWQAQQGEVDRKWYVVDASGKTLGRMATQIAMILRGKNKPTFTPHVDTGDFVVVINAEKVQMTRRKMAERKVLQPFALFRFFERAERRSDERKRSGERDH